MSKKCIKCGSVKELTEFFVKSGNKDVHINTCKECCKTYKSQYNAKNAEKISENKKRYYKDNRDKILTNRKDFYNKDKKKAYNQQYYSENKKNMQIQSNLHRKERRKTDLVYKLRSDTSTLIRRALKNNGGSKNNKSVLKYLPYTMQELKEHLENQFESWMNWKNHGVYNPKTWNGNDSTTWTWQIDHIIPQSDLPYTSMEDNNFKKCWMLENLRPLRSDINHEDGVNRKRHWR